MIKTPGRWGLLTLVSNTPTLSAETWHCLPGRALKSEVVPFHTKINFDKIPINLFNLIRKNKDDEQKRKT